MDVSLVPDDPAACPDAVKAVLDADLVVLGPGSWFSSVIPHLLVPELSHAVQTTSATRLVLLNLRSATPETEQYAPHDLLDVLGQYAPGLGVDVVLADEASAVQRQAFEASAARLGADLVLAPLAAGDSPDRHDPELLTRALAALGGHGRMPPWR
jgi:uncharacterized cofD-like protein